MISSEPWWASLAESSPKNHPQLPVFGTPVSMLVSASEVQPEFLKKVFSTLKIQYNFSTTLRCLSTRPHLNVRLKQGGEGKLSRYGSVLRGTVKMDEHAMASCVDEMNFGDVRHTFKDI